MEKKPKGMFVNLVNFPLIKAGKEAEFLEWFRWTNEVYAKHKGFISRTLLKPTEGGPNYAAIVEHESKETFMAMHLSKDREDAFKRVEPLFEGRPTPHFYEVVISHRK
jgi:antibiotic biosynthesis monooxygenase (ABM) superfamily enzyme